jgi:creatinine amidohydrolase
MSSDHLFLEHLTWEEVDRAREAGVTAVLLPIGSTEQHGPHMPLDTDCLIARELCRLAAEAAEQEGIRLLVAPTLNVTLSWYHMQFPGSLRLSTTTFLQVFREVCDSLAHHGFERVMAVNGHGGNIAALTVAVNHTMETTGRRVFLVQWWDLAADVLAEIEGPMIHAEEAETSIALALGQRVVAAEAARDAYDRGEAVRSAGMAWTSFGKYGVTHKGPGVVVPMDMLRDITASGVGNSTPRVITRRVPVNLPVLAGAAAAVPAVRPPSPATAAAPTPPRLSSSRRDMPLPSSSLGCGMSSAR